MRIAQRLALGVMALLALTATSAAQATSGTGHILAMAACPPWKVVADDPEKTKRMAESCQKDVDTIVPALSSSFGIAPTNVTTRVNAQADGNGVAQAIKDLAAKAKPEDRVVIYLNFHGGFIDIEYKGQPVKDEVLAAYSTQKPDDFAKAVAQGKWLAVKTVRDMIDQIQAREIVLIIEACEADAGMHDFRYDIGGRYTKNWNGREAVIFTSRENQAANYNEEGSAALFTETFAKNVMAAKHGNIRDVVHKSALETHRAVRAKCLKDEARSDLHKNRETYLDTCTQMPEVFDPYGLLDDIQVGGKLAQSAWRTIEDTGTSAVVKTTSKVMPTSHVSQADAKTAAPEAKAQTKEKQATADPFAWAEPYLKSTPAQHRYYVMPY